ncbi:hypothetical protein H311_04276, partial [Anncaliia algerae PRA109]
FNYSFKRLSIIPEKRNNETTIKIRENYAQRFLALPANFSEEQLIFIDEVRFNVSMRCNYGRSAIGKPANSHISNIRYKNLSICCAMNKSGIVLYIPKIGA